MPGDVDDRDRSRSDGEGRGKENTGKEACEDRVAAETFDHGVDDTEVREKDGDWRRQTKLIRTYVLSPVPPLVIHRPRFCKKKVSARAMPTAMMMMSKTRA